MPSFCKINDPDTFLWENTNEGHAIPYTEVYLDADNLTPIITPTSIGSPDFLIGNPEATAYGEEFGWFGSVTGWFSDDDIAADLANFENILDTLDRYEGLIETDQVIHQAEFDQLSASIQLLEDNSRSLMEVDLSEVGTQASLANMRHTLALSAIAIGGQAAQSSILSLFNG